MESFVLPGYAGLAFGGFAIFLVLAMGAALSSAFFQSKLLGMDARTWFNIGASFGLVFGLVVLVHLVALPVLVLFVVTGLAYSVVIAYLRTARGPLVLHFANLLGMTTLFSAALDHLARNEQLHASLAAFAMVTCAAAIVAQARRLTVTPAMPTAG